MSTFYDLDWHEARNGNYVTSHPETDHTMTVFQNERGWWCGVCNNEFLTDYFKTAEEACEQMERWVAGEEVSTRVAKRRW